MADSPAKATGHGPLARFLAMPDDDPVKTVLVALMLCLVCAVAVSVAAVTLRPLQERNKDLAFKREVLEVAGLYRPGGDIEALYRQIDARIVDLATGEYRPDLDPEGYSPQAARDPRTGTTIPPAEDLAHIKHRARFVPVYLVHEDHDLRLIILPIYGSGLWSTMYGLLALRADANTVAGVSFYEQAETAGLGAEIASRKWQAGWVGKRIYDDTGKVRFHLVKGGVTGKNKATAYGVDALSGATLTSNGVTDLVRYWLGGDGFGRYLARIKQREGSG